MFYLFQCKCMHLNIKMKKIRIYSVASILVERAGHAWQLHFHMMYSRQCVRGVSNVYPPKSTHTGRDWTGLIVKVAILH